MHIYALSKLLSQFKRLLRVMENVPEALSQQWVGNTSCVSID